MMNWSFWVELFVRSGVLLLVGEVLRRMSLARSAAFRHRLLVSVFVLLAGLPVLAVLCPEIPISLARPVQQDISSVTSREVSWRVADSSASGSLSWAFWIWMSGAGLAFVALAAGNIGAWRMIRRARPIQDEEMRVFARRLGGQTEILISDELRVPITCGLVRSRILLPGSSQSWTYSRLEAVILHELAHVRRGDLLVQLFVSLVAAIWWFQPLVWMIRRQLRRESEFACDAEALSGGFRASEYAAELLGVARSAGRDWRISSSAISMVHQEDLEERLKMILQPRVDLVTRSGVYLAGLVLGAASVGASAVSFDSGKSLENEGGSMKHVIISALLTSAGLSAGTVGGYVHDANGAAVADAKVSIYNADKSAKQESATGTDGKFSLSLGAGQYILRVEKPGFGSIFRAFDLKADSSVARDFTMPTEGEKAVADSSLVPVAPEPKHIRVGGQVAQSNLLVKTVPIYPVSAKQAGIQGRVEIYTTISKEGVPVDLRVVSSPSDDLSESAMEAVSQWRYRPTLLNGNPVDIETTIVVNYTLLK